MSGKNNKVTQNFRVSLDENMKDYFAERQNTITPCMLIISCCLIVLFIGKELFLNT